MSVLASDKTWLVWTGMETDLIFNEGYDLPEFSAFPMIDSEEGRDRLHRYYEKLIEIGRSTGHGVFLDTPTWMANPDRAAAVGYAAGDMPRVTKDCVEFAKGIKEAEPFASCLVSVQVGPRGDGYKAGMATVDGAKKYHGRQIRAAKEAGADIVSAYTLGSAEEAIGISLSAKDHDIPVLISFTVETDGKLANGMSLSETVAILNRQAKPDAIIVNCAHPDHIANAFDGGAWEEHISGFVANASRQSHEELDNSETLDDGDPEELGQQLSELKAAKAGFKILGGCCGTDLRHMQSIAEKTGA